MFIKNYMSYDLSQIKILIVEDMQPMLALTISVLTMFGFRNIHGAKTVQEGFELFRQYNHDIIITDWLMEPADGIEMIRLVRKNKLSPNNYVPIILMTGYSDRPRVEAARDSGVTEFLMKPYSARDLYARIVQIVEKPRQFIDAGDFFGPDRRRRKNFEYYGIDRRGSDLPENEEIELALRDLTDETKKL